jgi:hypothetical protein
MCSLMQDNRLNTRRSLDLGLTWCSGKRRSATGRCGGPSAIWLTVTRWRHLESGPEPQQPSRQHMQRSERPKRRIGAARNIEVSSRGALAAAANWRAKRFAASADGDLAAFRDELQAASRRRALLQTGELPSALPPAWKKRAPGWRLPVASKSCIQSWATEAGRTWTRRAPNLRLQTETGKFTAARPADTEARPGMRGRLIGLGARREKGTARRCFPSRQVRCGCQRICQRAGSSDDGCLGGCALPPWARRPNRKRGRAVLSPGLERD